MDNGLLDDGDLAEIARLGMSDADVRRQIGLLSDPPPPLRLVRPCTPGDGIVRIDPGERDGLLALWEEAAARGRLMKFVPASGAATRMFQSLSNVLAEDPEVRAEGWRARAAKGERTAQDLVAFVSSLDRFAFRDALAAPLKAEGRDLAAEAAGGSWGAILRALLLPSGLGYAACPKGLIPFHRVSGEVRTAFEEHLAEGAETVRGPDGRCRIHLTVAAEDEGRFREVLERVRTPLERQRNAAYEVTFSRQERSTDTVALDSENRPFRVEGGKLLFRPGGHGALLTNLEKTRGDVVYLKNIDNVLPGRRAGESVVWKRLLAGVLVSLERRLFHFQREITLPGLEPELLDEALEFLDEALGTPRALELLAAANAAKHGFLHSHLFRPLRVCGVVPNAGEPGGGPFWVAGRHGEETLQIVESSQVDPASGAQREIWASSTHFNPVDLVVGLRDFAGKPYDLSRFVDAATVFVSKKSRDGRELLALERPGLWNGAMAHWNTVFVEVPLATFAPVKTVLDLLRPEHRPAT